MSDLPPVVDPNPAPNPAPESVPAADPAAGAPVTAPPATAPPAGPEGRRRHVFPATPDRRSWAALGSGLVLLLLIIVFVAQNGNDAKVSFLWLSGQVSVGIAIMVAFVVGGLVVLLLGATRMVQLRLTLRKRHHAG